MPAVDVGSDWVPLRLRLDGVKSRGVCGRLAGNSLERLKIDGGQGRNRTADASLFRAGLCHSQAADIQALTLTTEPELG